MAIKTFTLPSGDVIYYDSSTGEEIDPPPSAGKGLTLTAPGLEGPVDPTAGMPRPFTSNPIPSAPASSGLDLRLANPAPRFQGPKDLSSPFSAFFNFVDNPPSLTAPAEALGGKVGPAVVKGVSKAATPSAITKASEVKSRILKTTAEDYRRFGLDTPDATSILQDTATLAKGVYDSGDPKQAALLAAELITDVPFTQAPEMIGRGQTPEFLGHALTALTMGGILGPTALPPGVGRVATPTPAPLNQILRSDPLAQEPLPQISYPRAPEPAPLPQSPLTYPGHEFVPVGQEPAPAPVPDPRAAVVDQIAKTGGRVGRVSPAMAEVEAMHADPRQAPSWDRVDAPGGVTPQTAPIVAPEGAQAPSSPLFNNLRQFGSDHKTGLALGATGAGAGALLSEDDPLAGAALGMAALPFMGKGPVWHSRLEKAMSALPDTPKGYHPNKVLGIARSATHADELKWTGFESWLGEQKGNVTKAQIEEFLKGHKLEVEEVVLTDPQDIKAPAAREYTSVVDELTRLYDQLREAEAMGRPIPPDLQHRIHTLENQQEGYTAEMEYNEVPTTKFHPGSGHAESLSLPGAKGYRELLLKMPTQEDTLLARRKRLIAQAEQLPPDQHEAAFEAILRDDPDPGNQHYRPAGYQSHHWPGQPNVLAHVRFTDRVSPEGKKVLFLEEVQSDWHQAGREKGYQGDKPPQPVKNFGDWMKARDPQGWTQEEVWRRFADENDPLRKEWQAEHRAAVEANFRQALAVPDAPFKGTRWQELALKRMIRWAAENGYDEVAWTTGLTQTKRYNDVLGAALGEGRVDWTYTPPRPFTPETIELFGADKLGDGVRDEITLLHPKTGETVWMGPASDLPGAVGKDLATQILKDVEAGQGTLRDSHRYEGWDVERDTDAPPGEQWVVVDKNGDIQSAGFSAEHHASSWLTDQIAKADDTTSGMKVGATQIPKDVSVGSAGMTSQYDTSMVNWANKYAKGWGSGVRRGKVQIPETQTNRISIATNKNIVTPPKAEEVWSLPVTPEMKASVLREGQPLGRIGLGPLAAMGLTAGGAVVGGALPGEADERARNAFLGGALGLTAFAAGAARGPRQRRVPAADSLPHQIHDRMKPNSPLTTARVALGKALQTFRHDILGDTFQSEHALKRAGLGDAADKLVTFKTKRLEILSGVGEQIREVTAPLVDSADYKDFWYVVRLSRDVNTADMGLTLEGGLDPNLARLALQDLLARVPPQVLDAVSRHRDLMRGIGDQMVREGKLHQVTVNRNHAYFPDVVLHYLEKEANPDSPGLLRAAPINQAGKRGWLKERVGGTRETLHDYNRVMIRYLTQVKETGLRDNLIKDLSSTYDAITLGTAQMPTRQGQNPRLQGHDLFLYKGDGEVRLFPRALTRRLNAWQAAPGAFIKAVHKTHNVWKSLTLRAVWGGFSITNYLGDVAALFMFNPVTSWPNVTADLLQAHRAVADQMKGLDPATLSPSRQQGLFLADLGRQEGLGTGAATADISMEFDPALRALRPPPATRTRAAARAVGDTLVFGIHKMDLMREYMENVPRLTEFMQRMEMGEAPPAAARMTRKVMIDYADLSPNEEVFLRGMLFPFYTFYAKNFARFTPGLSPVGAVEASKALGRGLGLITAATLYNQWAAPELEKRLPNWQRNQLHFHVPTSWDEEMKEWRYTTIVIADPLTLQLNQLGLGGLPQRLIHAMQGHSDLRDEVQESLSQIRNAALSPLSPIIHQGYAAIQGEDLRTGQAIRTKTQTAGQMVGSHLTHTLQTLAPGAQILRAARGAGKDPLPDSVEEVPAYLKGVPEIAGEGVRQFAIGPVLRFPWETGQSASDNQAAREYEAHGKAAAKMQADTFQLKQAGASPIAARFEGMSPKEVAKVWDQEWAIARASGGGRAFDSWASVRIAALKEMAAKDKRLVPLLKRYQVMTQEVGPKKMPYVMDELKKVPQGPMK